MDWTEASVITAHIAGAEEGHRTLLAKVNGFLLAASWADWVIVGGSGLIPSGQLSDVEVVVQ